MKIKVLVNGYPGLAEKVDSPLSAIGYKYEVEMFEGPDTGKVKRYHPDDVEILPDEPIQSRRDFLDNDDEIALQEMSESESDSKHESAPEPEDLALKEFETNGVEKPRFSLIPMAALMEVMQVMGYGAKKYAEYNFSKGEKNTTYTDAAIRHVMKYNMNEDIDPESKLHHLAHAISDLMMALDNELVGSSIDNRNKIYSTLNQPK